MRRHTYTNAALSLVAVLLGLNLLAQVDGRLWPASASAQDSRRDPATNAPPFNASEQRQKMIQALERLDQRMAKLESQLSDGVNVRVVSMPPVRVEGELPVVE